MPRGSARCWASPASNSSTSRRSGRGRCRPATASASPTTAPTRRSSSSSPRPTRAAAARASASAPICARSTSTASCAIGSAVRSRVCHLAEYDSEEGWFTLVLDYVEGGVQGDQIAGCTPDEARVALIALARLHAPVWNDLALAAADWINQPNPLDQALLTAISPGFFERFGDQIKPEHREVCERFIAVADAYMADAKPPLGLVHGDFRLDNLLFAGDAVHRRRLADGLLGARDEPTPPTSWLARSAPRTAASTSRN